MNCQKFLDDPILLPSPYLVQPNALPDAFAHLMEVLNDLMSLAREFWHNSLTTSFASQQNALSRPENTHSL
jgi:hypothetical protein